MGCGVCRVGCPKDAVRITRDSSRGLFRPEVDACLCVGCRRCLKICPGIGFDYAKYAPVSSVNEDHPGGEAVTSDCYLGHAVDESIRYSSSSGGVVTALLLDALEMKLISGAVVTKFSDEDPLLTVPRIATNREEIIAAAGSKYCPVQIGDTLQELKHRDGRFAVVGLPCHIHGIRKLQENDGFWKEKIAYCLGLYCLNNNSFNGTSYFLRAKGINIRDVKNIRYRGEGWPGKITINLQDGGKASFNRPANEPLLSERRLLKSAFHYDFMIPRCLTCPDLTSEAADVAFADPWHLGNLLKKEKKGKTLIRVRGLNGKKLIEDIRSRGKSVSLERCPPPDKYESKVEFASGVWSRILIRKKLGLAYPRFPGKVPRYSRRAMAMNLFYVGSYLSRFRRLWPLLPAASRFRAALYRILDAVS